MTKSPAVIFACCLALASACAAEPEAAISADLQKDLELVKLRLVECRDPRELDVWLLSAIRVAKGIRKTTSRFGARLEPFTHVNLMLYRGRGSLDTITQAEIIAPHRAIRDDLSLFAAGETMLEAVDRVAEEHERNVRVVLLLLSGLRSLEARPIDPAAVAESFLLKLLSVSGFHPSLTACAVCGSTDVQLFSAGLGGAGHDRDRFRHRVGLRRDDG